MRVPIILAAVSIGTLAAAVVFGVTHRDSQKEVRTTQLHVDGVPSDLPSLADVMKRTEAVVVAQVLSSRPSSIAPQGMKDDAGTFISTAYVVRVSEVISWPSEKERPVSLEVELPGLGDVDRGPYIQRFKSEHVRPLSVGATYVLFVRQHSLGRRPSAPLVWIPATNDDQSIVEVRGGRLAPRASTRLSADISRMTLAKLVDDVKNLARGGRR